MADRQGILVFSLPEEKNAFEISVKAIDYALAWDFLGQRIRSILKYEDPTDEQVKTLEMIQDLMSNLAIEYELVRPQ